MAQKKVAHETLFVIGSNAPKIRNHNSSFKKRPLVYAHELERIDPMKDLEVEWAQRMPQ
jgi:hypothetical protein